MKVAAGEPRMEASVQLLPAVMNWAESTDNAAGTNCNKPHVHVEGNYNVMAVTRCI
jgi:hypothetical protein